MLVTAGDERVHADAVDDSLERIDRVGDGDLVVAPQIAKFLEPLEEPLGAFYDFGRFLTGELPELRLDRFDRFRQSFGEFVH